MTAVRRSMLAGLLGVALALSGCSTQQPDLDPRAATELQEGVAEIATAASQERYDAAAEALTRVRTTLEEAAAAEEISVARYAEIDTALSRTEAVLAATVEELRSGEEDAQADAATDAAPDEPVSGGSDGPVDEGAVGPGAGGAEASGPAAPDEGPAAPAGGSAAAGGEPGEDPPRGPGENRGNGD